MPDQFPEGSLPALYGVVRQEGVFAQAETPAAPHSEDQDVTPLKLVFDKKRNSLTIDEQIEITGASYRLLLTLAEQNLVGAGQGLDPLEYPCVSARELQAVLNYKDESSARRAVSRTRNELKAKLSSAQMDPVVGETLIRTLSWHGYRLSPELVKVRMIATE